MGVVTFIDIFKKELADLGHRQTVTVEVKKRNVV